MITTHTFDTANFAKLVKLSMMSNINRAPNYLHLTEPNMSIINKDRKNIESLFDFCTPNIDPLVPNPRFKNNLLTAFTQLEDADWFTKKTQGTVWNRLVAATYFIVINKNLGDVPYVNLYRFNNLIRTFDLISSQKWSKTEHLYTPSRKYDVDFISKHTFALHLRDFLWNNGINKLMKASRSDDCPRYLPDWVEAPSLIISVPSSLMSKEMAKQYSFIYNTNFVVQDPKVLTKSSRPERLQMFIRVARNRTQSDISKFIDITRAQKHTVWQQSLRKYRDWNSNFVLVNNSYKNELISKIYELAPNPAFLHFQRCAAAGHYLDINKKNRIQNLHGLDNYKRRNYEYLPDYNILDSKVKSRRDVDLFIKYTCDTINKIDLVVV